jgi:hypothetical protein
VIACIRNVIRSPFLLCDTRLVLLELSTNQPALFETSLRCAQRLSVESRKTLNLPDVSIQCCSMRAIRHAGSVFDQTPSPTKWASL